MKLNAGLILGTLIASLITETTALERKRNTVERELEDGCEIDSNGKVVCKNDDNAKVDEDDCVDGHENCSFWASKGECAANPNYMTENCKKSCNNCPGAIDEGGSDRLKNDKVFLLESIKRFGVPQTLTEDDVELSNIRDTVSYMQNFVNADIPTHRMTQDQISLCRNTDTLCSYWAILGECSKNPKGMNTICAPACRSCHTIESKKAE